MSELPLSVGWYVKKYGYKTDICLFRAMDEYAAHVTAEKDKEIERLRKAIQALLNCPAIADGELNHPDWGCGETAQAESFARSVLNGEKADG